MEDLSVVALVAALLSVGLVQALIGMARDLGVKGAWTNVLAMIIGVGCAVLARAVFPEPLAAFTYAQVGVFGALNGLASTGLWRFRRGDTTEPTATG